METINHPKHYQGSCAESWDLSVLEWGAEYAIASWVIQAQQYYDRHREKNGLEDLKKAEEFLRHAADVRRYFENLEDPPIIPDSDFWIKADYLWAMISKAEEEYKEKAE